MMVTLVQPDDAFAKSSGLIVNIDNPSFRRLVMAIPKFEIDQSAKHMLVGDSRFGDKELARLLEFSGLFNFMAKSGYAGMIGKNGGAKKSRSVRGLDGIDLQAWKGIGVESLTLGKISRGESGPVLELRTIDINKGVLILGKRFTHIKKVNKVLRRYADLLLEAYTGKPGIFSTKIVFIGRKTKKSSKQVYICDFDGSNVIQVTHDNSPHLSPSWSPDGRSILFTSYKAGNPDLYRYDLANRKTQKIVSYKGLNSGGVFSPDGKLIALTGTVAGDADIYLTGPRGGKRKAFIRGSGLDVDPIFSPNGKWLAFVSGRFGNPHIFRANLQWNATKTAVKVVSDKRLTYAGWYNATPAWSPDSSKIAFAGYDREIDRFDIFMMNPDGSNLERLTLRTGDNESPSWSPNGQMVVFQSNRVGNKNIKGRAALFLMNRDGGAQRRINVGLYDSQTPKWSPVISD
jgi:TolB protein